MRREKGFESRNGESRGDAEATCPRRGSQKIHFLGSFHEGFADEAESLFQGREKGKMCSKIQKWQREEVHRPKVEKEIEITS